MNLPGNQFVWKSIYLEINLPEINLPGNQFTWKSDKDLEINSMEINIPGNQFIWESFNLEINFTWKSIEPLPSLSDSSIISSTFINKLIRQGRNKRRL